MNFNEIPKEVQEVAAKLLAKKLEESSAWSLDGKMETARNFAETIREAFEKLYG